MNILFLTLAEFESLRERNIYTDLLREFVRNGHKVYVISPVEKRKNVDTHLVNEENSTILRLRIGNTQKTNIIEKGISTVMIEPTFKKAIKSLFSDVKFDLVLYSTPPITLVSAIDYVKKRDNAKAYLLLKDIFPQNAVDIGLMSTHGIKGMLYKHFRKQETRLYKLSDRIGCMSQANVDYVIQHNQEIDPKKVEICPNAIDIIDKSINEQERAEIRNKYGIPLEKKVFVYGGNLGKPQGIPFLIECLKKSAAIPNAYFLIIGDGTEYGLLEEYVSSTDHDNIRLMKLLPKEDYDRMVGACDVGMVFLDYRFTIPNFPSRILSYMQAKMPVLAVTDVNTDIGKVIEDGQFGWWCPSNDSTKVYETLQKICTQDAKELGIRGYEYLKKEYCVKDSYDTIVREFKH